MDVSIIIVNFNTIFLLINAVDSVFNKTESIEYEIIVVDNNSSDNSKKIILERYGDKVIYLALPENIGFGRANNEAVKIAKGRNLFFLNPDTILINNAVKILSDFLDMNPHVGCCGGNLFSLEGSPNYSFSRKRVLSIFNEMDEIFYYIPSKLIFGKNYSFNHTNEPIKVCCIIGADLMIKNSIFNKLNGFDNDFFMYHEEAELEHRVSKMGLEMRCVPNAKIIHLEGKSITNNLNKLRWLCYSRKLYLQKTHNLIEISIVNILVCLKIISRILFFFFYGNKTKERYWLNMYRLTFQGTT